MSRMRWKRVLSVAACMGVAAVGFPVASEGIASGVPSTPPVSNPVAAAAASDLSGAPYWNGWDVARGVALRRDGPGGYTLDAWGGFHPFGGAPKAFEFHYTPGVGSAADFALRRDTGGLLLRNSWRLIGLGGYQSPGSCLPHKLIPPRGVSFDRIPRTTGSAPYAGATLDAYGNIRPLCDSPPLVTTGGPNWPGWPIARGLAITEGGTGGFVVDGWGGLHAFGRARLLSSGPYWPNWDIAHGVSVDTQGNGVVVDGFGGLHRFTYAVV